MYIKEIEKAEFSTKLNEKIAALNDFFAARKGLILNYKRNSLSPPKFSRLSKQAFLNLQNKKRDKRWK